MSENKTGERCKRNGTVERSRVSFWRKIPKPIIGLSPMDGITDASFRYITAAHGGADVTITEFVNVETAFYAPQTLIKDFTYSELERPVVAQIYGHTPEMFYKVTHIVCELGFDGLDINMGCPAKKVAAKGGGAALIRTPELAQSIIRAVMQSIADWRAGQTLSELKIHSPLIEKIKLANRSRTGWETPPARHSIPVSVKTRIGYDNIVIDQWIRTLLEERPAAIALHGRTLKQQYKGDADWEAIAQAVAAARGSGTLILGNGDLRDMSDIYRRVRESGVDGVLVGRAAQGNPWLFRSKEHVKQALRSGGLPVIPNIPITLAQRSNVMIEHARHFENHWGSEAFVGMRKHLAWYCHGLRRAAELRARMVRLDNVGGLVQCLSDYTASMAAQCESSASLLHETASPFPNGALDCPTPGNAFT
jgi:nifR3 family TIM-barrel protein